MTRPIIAIVAALAAFAFGHPASANKIVGQASVIDGDTIEIHGQRIRLSGIDAPEAGQTCWSADKKPWRCGQEAAFALADKIGRAIVHCAPAGRDRYRRTLAQCRIGNLDLGSWLIRTGRAVRYYDRAGAYRSDEEAARARGQGIWAGPFIKPSEWRSKRRKSL
ncbi:thermonuclease family protein [Paracoccus kondratievae]|uniref:Nuclease n=1 Tax=Paracoccus kondratievae TaxID=135740 RepID=A0A0G3B2Y5_9RHOB|nr:thermonuclease family protein [Paracoccus kondratievae]AKJ20471.1 nuclease [Paracoccus kondratievae]GLK65170.1 hypothetical protein GCM10017635_26410 [Paracoccus kondratievae]